MVKKKTIEKTGIDKRGFLVKILQLAGESLLINKVRALLTMLGIVIGAATIVLVVAMGEGAKRDIDDQFSNMSVTTILVNAPASAEGKTSKLDAEDAEELTKLETVVMAVPQTSGKVEMVGEGVSASFNVLGSWPEIFEMLSTELVEGRYYTQEEEDAHDKVVVIGATVAEEMFGESKAVGKELTLGKKSFEVVGALKYKGGSVGPTSIDESVFTPYDSAYRYVLGKKGKLTINAMAKDVDSLDEAMEDISKVLRDSHSIKAGGVDDFKVKDMGSNVQAAKDSAKTMSFLLGGVGLVVLVVGGIGIMNIMYVTVSERTKEIGLRKALGAKDWQIQWQFLFEAIILSFLGYAVGAVLATVMYYIFNALAISMVLVWWSYVLSFTFVMFTGVFFGFAPAKKAAEMSPIDALRHE